MVDASVAPLFSLMINFETLRNDEAWKQLPKTRGLAESLMNDDAVKQSRCPNYNSEFEKFFAYFKSYFPQTALQH
jgi:hypothetical protein